MIENTEEYQDKRVMIGADLQSCLKALALGPLCLFHYLGMDLSSTWEKFMVLDGICEEVVLHYVLAHVGHIGNELADQWVKQALHPGRDPCQFCGRSWETLDHLLSDCASTAPYWATHDLSLNTL
eukprot:365336-Ditylum_brightwellii.AAC.1